MQHQTNFQTHDMRLRAEWAQALCYAISECHPDDAKQIMAAALEDLAAGDPPMRDPFGDLRQDAAFWADCAHPVELEAYFSAALKRLLNRSLGIRARKRLLVALWCSLSDGDRRAFMVWAKEVLQ